MRLSNSLLASLAFLLCLPAIGSEAPADPFRVVPTPTGCSVVFDEAPDEYRIDTLTDGGVSVGLYGAKFSAQEKQLEGGCLATYRVSASYDDRGSTVELRPSGVKFSGVIRAQNRLQIAFDKVTEPDSEPAVSSADRSYRVGIGDVLQITVYNHADLTKEATVGTDGKINYSLLGNMEVAGKTVREVQQAFTTALGKEFIVNPHVSVEVKKYASQFVYVTGPVKNPGRFPLEGGTTLKDALSAAGGFLPEAGYTINVARRTTGADGKVKEAEQILFSRQDIEIGQANLELQPNDVVTVSERDYFYIQSEVRKPGRYELRPGLTVLQGIAVAEGLTDWADSKHIALIRVVNGETVRQTVNLRAIEKQKAPDLVLAAGDIIIVPRRLL